MSSPKDALDTIKMLGVGGLTLTLCGIVVAIATKPTTTALLGDTGSAGWYNVSLIAAALGSLLFSVAAVGWGVYLGVSAAREE